MATNNLDFIVKNGIVVTNTATILDTTQSNSTSSGALQVLGGAGIAKNLYVGGDINVAGTISATLNGNAATVSTVRRTTDAEHFVTFVDSNNAAAGSESIYTTSTVKINPGTGKLLVSTFEASGISTITNNTAATSTNSGAFQVVGGVGIGGDLYVGDHVYWRDQSSGSVNTGIYSPSSSYLQFVFGGVNRHWMDNVRIMAKGSANDVDNPPLTIDDVRNGLYSKSSRNLSVALQGANVVDFNTTPSSTPLNSTSTTTGALVVNGGVGIGGNLYVGGEIVAEKLTIQLTTVTTTLIETDDIIQTSNNTQATSTTTGALKVTGGAGIGGNIHVGGSITSNDNVYSSNSAAVSTTSTTSIDTFDKTVYRLSKYIIQVTQSTNYQASEVLILHNGSDSFITEYAVVRSGSNLANFSTDINGNNVRLLVNMISATAATIKMNRISILV